MNIQRILTVLVGISLSGGCKGEVTQTPSQLSDAQVAEMRRMAIERLEHEQTAGAIPQINQVDLAAAVDRTMAQVRAVRSWRITKGSFLGLSIGDSQSTVIDRLRALGADSIYLDRSSYSAVSSADDLPHLYSSSEFVMHPLGIHVTLDGDHVKSVTAPTTDNVLSSKERIRGATTRAEVFSAFAIFLRARDGSWIERVDSEPSVVDIRSQGSHVPTDLSFTTAWLSDFHDSSKFHWQLRLTFDDNNQLLAFDAVSGTG